MTTIHDLFLQRNQLHQCAALMRESIQDIDTIQKEGTEAAGYAAAWAAVLMTTDILRIGLSAGDRRARLLFQGLDRAIARADKVLVAFGQKPTMKKSDLMASLDPELRGTGQFIKDVREAQGFLKGQGVKPPKQLKLVMDLAMAMTEDTLLMLNAGQLQKQVGEQARHGRMQAAMHLKRVLSRLAHVDAQILQAFDQRDLFNRTA